MEEKNESKKFTQDEISEISDKKKTHNSRVSEESYLEIALNATANFNKKYGNEFFDKI